MVPKEIGRGGKEPEKKSSSSNDTKKSDLLLVQEAHQELEKCLALVRQDEEQNEHPSSEALEKGRELLKHLDTLCIDKAILTKTQTGKLVAQFRKHPKLRGLAKTLITKWKGICHEFDKQREQEQKEREARGALGNDAKKSDLLLVQEAHQELERCMALVRQEEQQKEPHSSETLEKGRDLLKHMDTLCIDKAILAKTQTGKLVARFKKHPELRDLAQPLITKWKGICHEFDKQREQEQKERERRGALRSPRRRALDKYRKRVNELKGRGQAKPDMVAFRELRNRCNWLRERCHGELNSVPIGLVVTGRGEAAILGIHTNILSGMDSIKGEPCYAVCLSGGYKDDEASSSGGTIWYTGSGGQKGGRQVEDQRENSDNASLLRSLDTGDPIRLLRSYGPPDAKPPLYIYMGLYSCTDYTYEASVDGPFVYKFQLEPVEGKSLFRRPKQHGAHLPGKLGEENTSSSNSGQTSINVRLSTHLRGNSAQAHTASLRKRKRACVSNNVKNRLNAKMAKHNRS